MANLFLSYITDIRTDRVHRRYCVITSRPNREKGTLKNGTAQRRRLGRISPSSVFLFDESIERILVSSISLSLLFTRP